MYDGPDWGYCETCKQRDNCHEGDCPAVSKNPGLRFLRESDLRRIVRDELGKSGEHV